MSEWRFMSCSSRNRDESFEAIRSTVLTTRLEPNETKYAKKKNKKQGGHTSVKVLEKIIHFSRTWKVLENRIGP